MKTAQKNDKKYEKVLELIGAGAKLGAALKKTRLSYPAYRARFLKAQKAVTKSLNEPESEPKKDDVLIALNYAESVIDKSIKALGNIEGGLNYIGKDPKMSYSEAIEILQSVKDKLTYMF